MIDVDALDSHRPDVSEAELVLYRAPAVGIVLRTGAQADFWIEFACRLAERDARLVVLYAGTAEDEQWAIERIPPWIEVKRLPRPETAEPIVSCETGPLLPGPATPSGRPGLRPCSRGG